MNHVLIINSGSSSIKFALYEMAPTLRAEHLLASGRVEKIGLPEGLFRLRDCSGKEPLDLKLKLHVVNHKAAVELIMGSLKKRGLAKGLEAVGHRIVHGGPIYDGPQEVTAKLLDDLRNLIPLAPAHLPSEIEAVEIIQNLHPAVKQVACFDTAFHRNMPSVAKKYALPAHLGVVRYGFHGLSYEYIMSELSRMEGAAGRIIIAHLGNGASMAAIQECRSVETTMGFTPAGGLVMSTRPGDVDPGVMVYIDREKKVTPQELDDLINRHSGLLAVSGTSSDMEDLIEKYPLDARAKEAVDLFCYSAKKAIGALAAVLGGLDGVVFM